MITIVFVVLFFAATLGLFLLPFVPGLREIRRRRDARALPISSDALVRADHFATGFRAFLDSALGDPLARVRTTGMSRSGLLGGQGDYAILAASQTLEPFSAERAARTIDRLIAGAGDLAIPPGMRCARELYAGGTLRAGAGAELRAALAEEDLVLEQECRAGRWLHAGRTLTAAGGCRLEGRATAGERIGLAAGVVFERLHAPIVHFGAAETPPPDVPREAADPAPWRADGVSARHESAAGRLLVHGDLEIPESAWVQHDLVVRGALTIGARAQIDGGVKCYGALRIGDGGRIAGAAIGRGDVTLGADVQVDGPVIAEARLRIGAGCVVGAPDAPSTVRAGSIDVRAGTRVHGTVWASGRGEVKA